MKLFPVTLLAIAVFLTSAFADAPKKTVSKAEKHRANIDEFFSLAGPVAELSFEFAAEELEKLRKDPRNYAEATMTEAGGKTYRGVGVKLKGGRSFRQIDDKPALTVNMKKYDGVERFHGMEKFHLNNSVQDPTFLHEIISAEVCREAGVPAARGTHAVVTIGGKPRGLYVFKEAFDEDFLSHFFKDPTGDLYDGGRFEELSDKMEKDQGDDAERDNIKELIAACQESDPAKRWARLEAIFDVDAYIDFTAIEAILAHSDGYNFNHNNYRVYFDPATGRARFIHHGMDKTFAWDGFSVFHPAKALVWGALFSNPQWQAKYFGKAQEAFRRVAGKDWAKRIDEIGGKVEKALAKSDEKLAAEFPAKVALMQKQVQTRFAFVDGQLRQPPQPPAFDAERSIGVADGWTTLKLAGTDFVLDVVPVEGGEQLHLRAAKRALGRWEKTVYLEQGRYRLEGRVKTAGVAATADGKGKGVLLAGQAKMLNPRNLSGDNDWQAIGSEFDTPTGDVLLAFELRGERGEAWCDRSSLRLVRLK